MKTKHYVAVDLGATSGRVVTGAFNGKTLRLEEEHRFINGPVKIHNTVYWDILYLYQNILIGIKKAASTKEILSIGIDSWGNDYALFDKEGKMLGNPIHYRDEMSKGMPQMLYKYYAANELYMKTGIQHMRINGLYRVFAMFQNCSFSYENAARFLMIPDIITYFLTGEMINEFTNATTTQMVDAQTKDWAYDMLCKVNINTKLFSKPANEGSDRIQILNGIVKSSAKVSIIGTHDTASAVAAVPSLQEDFIYISSGTWSLVGTETKAPVINELSLKYNFTNEGGVLGKNRLLKNVMGMWILEELRREWKAAGDDFSYPEIIAQSKKAKPFDRIIDPDDTVFMDMENMTSKINTFLEETGQKPAVSTGEFARCLFDSLALRYKNVIDKIAELTGKTYNTVHIVGGGSKNSFLNQITADVCGMQVFAGPVEATAVGNILTQAHVCRDISGLKEIREICADSFNLIAFEPQQSELTMQAYANFMKIINYDKKGEKR